MFECVSTLLLTASNELSVQKKALTSPVLFVIHLILAISLLYIYSNLRLWHNLHKLGNYTNSFTGVISTKDFGVSPHLLYIILNIHLLYKINKVPGII